MRKAKGKKKTGRVSTTFATVDDKIVKTTTVEDDRHIDWNDIEARVESDDDGGAPWEDCDGWEHTEVHHRYKQDFDHNYADGDCIENAQGFCYSPDAGQYYLITISDDDVRNWGFSDTEFYPGASRQVSREMFAHVKARNLKQLVAWYRDGWNVWGAIATYDDITESCWGIDDYAYAQEMAETELRSGVAYQLEQRGYIIDNEPPAPVQITPVERMRDNIRNHLAYANGI